MYLDGKEEHDGLGRKFLYYQIGVGDSSDNYDPACLSTKKNQPAKVFKALKEAKTDKECWEFLVSYYRDLYPEPVDFRTFRGDDITVNWLDVLQEISSLAFMLRWEGDKLDVHEVLTRMKIPYRDYL